MKLANLLVGLLLVAFTVNCDNDSTPEQPAGTSIAVTSVALGNTIDAQKRVLEPADKFRPTETIYASVETEGRAQNVTLKADWTFEDGQTVASDSHKISPDGAEVTEFHIHKPDGFPEGDYRVTISVNGEPVQTKSFEID